MEVPLVKIPPKPPTKPKSGPGAKDPNSKTQRKIRKRTREHLETRPEMLERRDRFVTALIQGYPKYQAALMAGVPPRSAHKEASTMWAEPYVQEQFRKLRDQIEEEQIVCRKDIIIGLLQEARNDGPGGVHMARVAAYTQLAKIMGYEAPQKTEVAVNGGVMMVPMAQDTEQWEEVATKSQKQLKTDVRT